jgi:hypothetical protein
MKLIDIGSGWSFFFGIGSYLHSAFLDMDTIDIVYQPTSDTKLAEQRLMVNGAFALIFLYGKYRNHRR